MRGLVLLIGSCAAVWAQTADEPTAKIVHVHYVEASRVGNVVGHAAGAVAETDNTLQVIALRGKASVVADAERMIKELDVPASAAVPHDIELTVSVIGASTKQHVLPESAMPADLNPVAKQLKAAFPYGDYQLLSSMLLRSAQGAQASVRGEMRSVANIDGHERGAEFTVAHLGANVREEAGARVVHLSKFSFSSGMPLSDGQSTHSFDIQTNTDVDLREGQKIVVGKTNLDTADVALFIVLTAKVVD